MQKILNTTIALSLVVLLAACGSSSKDDKGQLGEKKAALEKLKTQQKEVNDKIAGLEEEIAKLDPTAATSKAKLVAVTAIGSDTFSHFIDLQGKIDAQNVAMVSPRGQGGVVRSIHVKQGQQVRKGQLVLQLDNAIAQQQADAAAAQISGLQSQVKLAESIYERQQNLWKSNIGTEVQVLQAKTNAENAQAQLNAAQANLKVARENAGLGNVYAEINGTVDVVNIRVGEFFSPQSAGMAATGIRIVNTGDLKVLVQVPENYLNRVNTGTALRIILPEINNKVINSKVSVTSKLIDPTSRTFFIEGKVPQDKEIKPNQLAKVQILDYSNSSAITIPVNTLQTDDKGKFVLVAVTENGKLIARKKVVVIGELYEDRLEVKSGLSNGDKLITDGFQSLYDGQLITTGS